MSERVAVCSGCGPIPLEEFGNHTCKPKDPIEQLREMREMLTIEVLDTMEGTFTAKNSVGIREHNANVARLVSALEAVLAMPRKPIDKDAIGHDVGYNSALSEVHSLIASALGGGGE